MKGSSTRSSTTGNVPRRDKTPSPTRKPGRGHGGTRPSEGDSGTPLVDVRVRLPSDVKKTEKRESGVSDFKDLFTVMVRISYRPFVPG